MRRAGCSPVISNADDLGCGGSGQSAAVPATGFAGSNLYCLADSAATALYGSGSGYVTGTTSPPNVFFDGFGSGASITKGSGSFQFVSAQVTAAFESEATVTFTFTAVDGSTSTGTADISNSGPTLVTADALGLPAGVSFTGFSFHDPAGGPGHQVALDDITLCAIDA